MLASTMKILEPVQPKRRIRHRVIRGPQAHSYGMIERKYNSSAAQKDAIKSMQQEQFLRKAEEDYKRDRLAGERLKWEDATERKIFFNNVKTEVDKHLKNDRLELEARQEQLRQLLSREEEEYIMMIEQKEETPKQRQDAMKQKAQFLKDKRETERLKFVQEKLDQQFRQQCAPIREARTKLMCNEISSEWQEQITLRQQADAEKRAVDDMYATLWREDSEKKIALEEQEVKGRQRRNKQLAIELRNQMAQLENNKQKEDELKAEQLKLLLEQVALQKVEDQREFVEKKKKQQERKETLDKTLQYRLKRKAKMEQEELAADIKIMENLMKDTENEKQLEQLRKRERSEENDRYLTYLRKLLAEEKAREKEMQLIFAEDVENQWQKRLARWCQERASRKLLIDDVIRIRGQQLVDKLAENNKRQEESEREKQEMLMKIEAYKNEEAEAIAKKRNKLLQHRRDLQGQMDFNRRQLESGREFEAQQYKKELQAELELQRKIDDVLSMPFSSEAFLHPMRRASSK